jgi:hypothetical protein
LRTDETEREREREREREKSERIAKVWLKMKIVGEGRNSLLLEG